MLIKGDRNNICIDKSIWKEKKFKCTKNVVFTDGLHNIWKSAGT